MEFNAAHILHGEIYPRRDIAPDVFRLRAALQTWFDRESRPDGLALALDQEGLASLLAGEPPPPLQLRHLAWLESIRDCQGLTPLTSKERCEATEGWLNTFRNDGADADEVRRMTTAVFLWFHSRRQLKESGSVVMIPGSWIPKDCADVAASLRAAGIAELVQDVRIGARSWAEL